MYQQINLYQRLPKTEPSLLDSPRIWQAYLAMLCLFLICFGFLLLRQIYEKKQLTHLDTQLQSLNQNYQVLYEQSQKNNTGQLAEAVLELKQLVALKNEAITQMYSGRATHTSLYSDRFYALASLHIPQIQIESILFQQGEHPVLLNGKASSGGAVMYLVKQLAAQASYQDLYFSDVSVSSDKDADNLYHFTITASEKTHDFSKLPRH